MGPGYQRIMITNLELEKENNLYEREQLAAKLQNLKTQFRNRKIAVDEGENFIPRAMFNSTSS